MNENTSKLICWKELSTNYLHQTLSGLEILCPSLCSENQLLLQLTKKSNFSIRVLPIGNHFICVDLLKRRILICHISKSAKRFLSN